jgi:hypothetical protein
VICFANARVPSIETHSDHQSLMKAPLLLIALLTCLHPASSQELGSFPHLHPIEGNQAYCCFTEGDGYVGLCNKEGKQILPSKYTGIHYAGANRFITTDYETGSRRFQLFNEFGKHLLTFRDWFVLGWDHYREGLLKLSSPTDQNVAYIDLNGKYTVPPGRYNLGEDYNEDFAAVQKNEKDGTCNCGYLDHK